MPEEARFLIDHGLGYVVDDWAWHASGTGSREAGFAGMNSPERKTWFGEIHGFGSAVAKERERSKERKRMAALEKMEMNKAQQVSKTDNSGVRGPDEESATDKQSYKYTNDAESVGKVESHEEPTFFGESGQTSTRIADETRPSATSDGQPMSPARSGTTEEHSSCQRPEPYPVTPTTSYPPLSRPKNHQSAQGAAPYAPASLPHALSVLQSYPLYTHLNTQSYFLTPGLRFGCSYLAYPGDPLRFHSHFLVVGRGWDEEVELGTIIGAGRLGTGVKKGVLWGGVVKKNDHLHDGDEDETKGDVRTFCVEWGGM